MYASPYSAPNYSAFLPYTADLGLFSQMVSEHRRASFLPSFPHPPVPISPASLRTADRGRGRVRGAEVRAPRGGGGRGERGRGWGRGAGRPRCRRRAKLRVLLLGGGKQGSCALETRLFLVVVIVAVGDGRYRWCCCLGGLSSPLLFPSGLFLPSRVPPERPKCGLGSCYVHLFSGIFFKL